MKSFIRNKFERIADHFRYKGHTSKPLSERNVNLTTFFSLAVALICTISFTAQYLALGPKAPVTVYLLPITALCAVVSLYSIRFFNSYLIPVNLQLMFDFIVILIRAQTSGGITSPTLSWLIPLASVPFMLLSLRNALIWSGIVSTAILFIAFPEYSGLYATGKITNHLVYFIVVLIPIPLQCMLMYIFERERIHNEARVLQAEKELAASKKTLALNAVSSGFAHEINNPLTVVKGYMSLFSRLIGKNQFDQKVVEEAISDINENVTRIENIVNSLRTFTADDFFYNSTPIHLNKFLNKYLQKKKSFFKQKDIELKFHIPSHDCLISGQIELLEKVFDNLINNSFEAIHSQTKPWIEVTLLDLTKEDVFLLTFADSGLGIDQAVAERIMEPFFSYKKDADAHAGVGLPLCQNIMRLHKSTLVLNKQSAHTEFQIRFPKLNKKS